IVSVLFVVLVKPIVFIILPILSVIIGKFLRILRIFFLQHFLLSSLILARFFFLRLPLRLFARTVLILSILRPLLSLLMLTPVAALL
ncbi:hypothetical protein, partial [Anaerostipes hadrus]|uniref:hypothetical protein n=1 Tax=Anaerostipes hadrus TaxID=649756 RepID=UPI001D089378